MDKSDFEAYGFRPSGGDATPGVWFFDGGDTVYPLRLMYDANVNNLRLTTNREAGFYGQIIAGMRVDTAEEIKWVFDRIGLQNLLSPATRPENHHVDA